jgi:hypothetical protein
LRARHVGVADRGAMRVIGRAAGKAFFDFEMDKALPGKPRGNFLGFRDDLGADWRGYYW